MAPDRDSAEGWDTHLGIKWHHTGRRVLVAVCVDGYDWQGHATAHPLDASATAARIGYFGHACCSPCTLSWQS